MQALSLLDERALPEWAAFAATLARRMAELLPQQLVGLGDPVWAACVDRFLLKAVDIDSQVAAPHCNDDCTYVNCDAVLVTCIRSCKDMGRRILQAPESWSYSFVMSCSVVCCIRCWLLQSELPASCCAAIRNSTS